MGSFLTTEINIKGLFKHNFVFWTKICLLPLTKERLLCTVSQQSVIITKHKLNTVFAYLLHSCIIPILYRVFFQRNTGFRNKNK